MGTCHEARVVRDGRLGDPTHSESCKGGGLCGAPPGGCAKK